MNILRHRDPFFFQSLEKLCQSSSLFDARIEERTRGIIGSVAGRGDEAIAEFTLRFDGAQLTAGQFAATQAEFVAASLAADDDLRRAIEDASTNIERFSIRSRRKGWSGYNRHGGKVGEKYDPFQRVGIYVPGGTAPLVSTALMTVTLARVAGCPEIVVCTPCNAAGEINAALLFALRRAGATEIYKVGGAQAIAAMALGTPTIRKVQKVFGPGNAYVVAAKRLLFGHVGIDLLPGPSELLVIADETAPPAFIAGDLLAQAEHGSGHERVWLLTPSATLFERVKKEMEKQLKSLARREFIERALNNNGWLIQVKDLEEAVEWANRLAPEHCEIITRRASSLATRVTTAGAIFLGPWSPTVLGDYVAGPSHTLPTGGAGKAFPGLTVDQFQRRTSVVEYSRASLQKAIPSVRVFAQREGLDAHGRSATLRLEKPTPRKR